tara:strand:+ start:158 stop:562 length:405 start_codon:yes stop_codon:yes gene_type:complete
LIDTAVIYSRLNSKRLKKKALLKIYKKKTLIDKVVQNTLKIKSIKNIIIATTKFDEDKIFERKFKKNKINFFYGSTNNLIKRTVDCSKKYNFKYFLRICGDRPFFSHLRINKIISNLNKKKIDYDLITNNKKKK